MHKIYTRYRFRIPKINKREKNRFIENNKNKIIKIIFIITIACLTVKTILDAVMPIFNNLCENRAKSIATIIANEQTTEVMKQHKYEELFSIEKDKEDNVKMIKSNIISINEISSDIAVRIQKEIDNRGRDNIGIAIGSFSGFKLLAGKGPEVKIQISSIGNIETEIKSEFISKGINQTLHRVYIKIKCQINVLTPFDNITKDITNEILLAENVIVGNIPETYYNIEGINEEKDTMELIE
ncbi:MAG: sporulation protein YunB [Clostridia bacterium]|nr:sporulation protein YunB [Clostridia bacterium]